MVDSIKIESVFRCDSPEGDVSSEDLLVPRPDLLSTKKRATSGDVMAEKKLVYCSLCHASFRRPDHLKRHMHCLHANFKLCKCPACNKQFSNEAAVKKHVLVSHCNKKSIFKCRVCQLPFNSFISLSKHEATQHGTRHPCPHCSTLFKRRDHMLRHIKSKHLNQHEVCQLCGLTYKRKDHLVKHMREKHKAIPD